MKIQYLILPALFSISIGCGSGGSEIEKGSASQQDSLISVQSSGSQPPAKTAIQHNRSEITGEIIKINVNSDSSFSVVLRVLEITEDTSIPSVAVKDNVYEVYPGLILDERKKVADIQKNKNLLSLKNKKKGDRINGVIFLGNDNKWILKDFSE